MDVRKRWGIVMLGCIIGASLGIAPLIDAAGCKRVEKVSESNCLTDDSAVMRHALSDREDTSATCYRNIRRSERSEGHRQSDSVRAQNRRHATRARSKAGSAKRRSASRQTDKGAKERSLRDDVVNQ